MINFCDCMGMENAMGFYIKLTKWHELKMFFKVTRMKSRERFQRKHNALALTKSIIRFWIWIFKCNVLLSYNRLFLLRVQRKEKRCGGCKSLLLFSLNKSISCVDFIHIAREWRIDKKKGADWKQAQMKNLHSDCVYKSFMPQTRANNDIISNTRGSIQLIYAWSEEKDW